MTAANTGLWERLLRWWRSRLRSRLPGPQPQGGSTGGASGGSDEQRYEVQSADGQTVATSGTLTEAHRDWQQLTDQQGRIIDSRTGQDVTPPPDDDGRYVVVDAQSQQVGSFDDRAQAEEVWRDGTNERGRIVDTQTGEDVTPRRERKLSVQQVAALQSLVGGRGPKGPNFLEVDPDLVRRMIEQINRLPVPVFDVTNITGQKVPRPTKTVPITRRKVTIEKVRKQVEVEVPGPPRPSGRIEVHYPTDEPESQLMRSVSDLRRVPPQQLAIPDALRRSRIARRQLMRRTFEEEVPGPPTVRKRKVWQWVEEPKVREWTEEVEVSEEPQAQLLEVVVDVSGSMMGIGINLAIALASVVIGGHLDDGSRYFYRAFANAVSDATKAMTPAEKRKLVRDLLQQDNELGGGTNIVEAITKAAHDVRRIANDDDRPEVLLITDGRDSISAEDVFRAIGEDVILHTVLVNAPTNYSLKARSSTYYELQYDEGSGVTGATGGSYRSPPFDDDW